MVRSRRRKAEIAAQLRPLGISSIHNSGGGARYRCVDCNKEFYKTATAERHHVRCPARADRQGEAPPVLPGLPQDTVVMEVCIFAHVEDRQ